MISVAIVGLGNIGRYVVDAVNDAPDMELRGIVRRHAASPVEYGVPAVEDISALGKVDVAILCIPSRSVPDYAQELLSRGISTVDSYDMHAGIWDLKQKLAPAAKNGNAVSIISAGWDPGTDSCIRALMLAMAPKGITYTNFGPGMSMGHTVAVKAIAGVQQALSVTIPTGTGIHRRMVYVALEDGADINEVSADIKADPYFSHDETHVIQVADVDALLDMGHGVHLTRKGVSGITQNQLFEFNMTINNPALTAQIMVSCARAASRKQPGCYTMIELAPIDLLCGDEDAIIKSLV